MDKNASAHGRCMSSTSVEKEAIEKSHVIVVQKIYRKRRLCAPDKSCSHHAHIIPTIEALKG
jgi:hypothetical protein